MKILNFFVFFAFSQILFSQSQNESVIDSLWNTSSYNNIIHYVDSIGVDYLSNKDLFYYSLSYLQMGDFHNSLNNLNKIQSTVNDSSLIFLNSLYYKGIIERELENNETAVQYFYELISYDSLQYDIYPEIIQCYFRMSDYKKARNYQDVLYSAYANNQLPEELSILYVYDYFDVDSFHVRCSEAFPELGTPETEGSFSKTFAYVNDQNHNLLYVLETVKIHGSEGKDKRYLLNKRYYNENWQVLHSESFWEFTFTNPIDYAELKNAIITVIRNSPDPTATTDYNRD